MDWEAHVNGWSRAAVRLTDIRLFSKTSGTLPERYVTPTGFFVVATQGEAQVSLEGIFFHVAAPHVLHGGRGSELSLITLGDMFSCYLIQYEIIGATVEERESFRMPYVLAPYSTLPLHEKCQTMHRLWKQDDPLDKLQAQSVLLPFVYEMMRQAQITAAGKGKPNIVTDSVRYLNEHYKEQITAEVLAGMQGCSASYLSRLFKNQLGMGPIDYLIHVRIFKAKQLLVSSKVRIQEIAKGVGYGDVYYFSRLFKKHVGRSPLQFRQEYRKPVQNNPLPMSKLSIVTPTSGHHNENESYYQLDGEGDTSMFRFSRPAFGAMMLLCTALILNACQAGAPAPGGSQIETAASRQPEETAATDLATNEAGGTRMYKHLKGEDEIPANPERVVSLYHLGEIMALGVKPVGATSYILRNPFLDDVTDITDVGVPPDLEKVLALAPDLIVTTAPFAEVVEGGYEALKLIAPTIVVEQHNDPIKDIEMFGDILGKQEEAKQRNEAFAAKIAEYKKKVAPFVESGETFSILNVRPGSVFIYGDTNMGGNIIYKYLGLKPTEKVESEVINGETWEISAEAIPEFVGDHLFLAVNEGAEEDLKKVEKLLQTTSAGKAGQIYPIDFDQFLLSDPISVDHQLDIIVDLLTEGNN